MVAEIVITGTFSDVYLPCVTFKVERFAKIVIRLELQLNIFGKKIYYRCQTRY